MTQASLIMQALEAVLLSRLKRPITLTHLERRPSDYASSHLLEEWDARLSDGTTLPLIAKALCRSQFLAEADRAKPTFLYDPHREAEAYSSILEPVGLGTATYYGTIVGSDGPYLVLERVRGARLEHTGEFEAWEAAARWIAELHAWFDISVSMAPLPNAHLLRHDAAYYRLWMERALAFASQLSTPEARERALDGLNWLSPRYEQVVARLLALPHTLIHGEFYASNVLLRDQESGGNGSGSGNPWRVCPVDWETAAIGVGLSDLAGLTSGDITEAQLTLLVLAYREAWNQSRPDNPLPDQKVLLNDLDYCLLQAAVQWLGWSSDWSPPPAYAHDWLDTALNLAKRLNL
jgi:hypothetical protein